MKTYQYSEWEHSGNLTFVDLNNNLITGKLEYSPNRFVTIKEGRIHNPYGMCELNEFYEYYYLEGEEIITRNRTKF